MSKNENMRIGKVWGFVLGLLVCGSAVKAQDLQRCYMDEIHAERMANDPLYKQAFEETQANFAAIQAQLQFAKQSSTDSALYYIPTVVHIFHDGGAGNIDIAQIYDGMRILNEDYRKMNADTGSVQSVHKPVHTDTQIEFRLARLDPDGNCTSGIVYHRTPMADENYPPNCTKALSSWDNDMYMNIYLVPSLGGLLGYSAFPATNQTELEDGNFMLSGSFGSIGSAVNNVPYHLGRTTTHEVGHYLNVFHTFQGGCSGSGDGCPDTPPTASSTFGCPNPFTSCGGTITIQTENFMDYGNDPCLLMFSEDQKNLRMFPALNDAQTRGQLVTQANYIATGILDPVSPCAPQPDYLVSTDVICAGQTITYTDNHYNGSATSRLWEFPGGSPGTSTDSIVTVTYNTPGNYGFKLSVTNALGTNLTDYQNTIVVTSSTGIPADQWAVGFENASEIGNEVQWLGWELGNNFERVTSASAEGNASMRVNGFAKQNDYQYTQNDYQKEYLYLPAVDLTTQGASELRFSHAYAAQSNFNDSELRVQVSNNCGTSWQTRLTLSGNSLQTASNTTSTFTPNASQWNENTINLSAFSSSDDLRIRLQFTADRRGNNLYVDDFYLVDQTIGIDESPELSLNAFPNPANNQITLVNGALDSKGLEIRLTDLSGREALVQKENEWLAGEEVQLHLPSGLAAGIYVLRVVSEQGSWTRKWIIE